MKDPATIALSHGDLEAVDLTDPVESPPQPQPKIIGKYRLVREIGRGAMGLVFEGVHESLGQRAAVKILHPVMAEQEGLEQRFLNEARAISMVQHPGLVKVYDFGQLPDGTLYILMEHLEGETLQERLSRLGPMLPVPDALRLFRQLASALSAAHAKGIVHRDLKPANIFITADPEAPCGERAKLLDFGVAKIMTPPGGADGDPQHQTKTGMILGTPLYMAPEQCRGTKEVGEKTDVYALGAVLYQVLAGRVPFPETDLSILLSRHLTEMPVPLHVRDPSVPQPLSLLVQGMMAKERHLRPSMEQVTCALENIAPDPDGEGKTEIEVPVPGVLAESPAREQPTRMLKRASVRFRVAMHRPWFHAVLAVLALGLTVAAGSVWVHLGKRSPPAAETARTR